VVLAAPVALISGGTAAQRDYSGSNDVALSEVTTQPSCESQASQKYAEDVARCESGGRGHFRADQCKRRTKSSYDRAVSACVAARKAGGGQMDFPGPETPPKEPPPKEPTPK
jgi:hypothetical protein